MSLSISTVSPDDRSRFFHRTWAYLWLMWLLLKGRIFNVEICSFERRGFSDLFPLLLSLMLEDRVFTGKLNNKSNQ